MPTTTPAEILSTVEEIVDETSVDEQDHEIVKNIVEVSSDNTFILPTNISVSLPVAGPVVASNVLKNVSVVDNEEQDITLEDAAQIVETEIPVVPMCTLKANAQHPAWFQAALKHALQTGTGYDTVWYCSGAAFRVHKFVLAAFSDHMKIILPEDSSEATIYTPDLTSDMVTTMLCLIYTGEASVTWRCLQDINNAFKLIGFCGKDMTAIPSSQLSAHELKSNISIAYEDDMDMKPVFTPIKLGRGARGHGGNSQRPTYHHSALSTGFPNSTLLTPAQLEDQGLIFDNSDQVEMLDTVEAYVDDYDDQDSDVEYKPRPNKAIKIELEESEEDELNNYFNILGGNVTRTGRKIKTEAGVRPVGRPRGSTKKPSIKRDLDMIYSDEEDEFGGRIKRSKNSSWADKTDTRETKVSYGVSTKDKGVLSRRLPFDLFDDEKVAEAVKTITVCPICFMCFQDRDAMKEHRIEEHSADVKGIPTQSPMILGRHKFKCDKCEETLELKHLVWFVKHYKYCGVDDIKANELLRVNDVEEKAERSKSIDKDTKKNSRDKDVVYVLDKPKLKDMCRFMLGKVVDDIWGCRKCYQPFDSEQALVDHINADHEGKNEHGTCYDFENKVYSCMNCKVFKTSKCVVYFIYHLMRCNVSEQGAIPIDDEEDVDEDTNEDFIDPWGIINKPLKIRSSRSQWMCEAMFGQLYDTLFPCHICYTVYKSEEELREHFRITHPGLQNYPEHGSYFLQDEGAYSCPTCKRIVCKKQKNSIYFAYHMMKCNNKTYPVTRSCPACGKSFSVFRTYQYHIQTKCGTTNFVCHICGMVLKNFHGLKCHVMYAHSDIRPYHCKVCNKTFKRSADLDHHTKLHMGSMDWSCEKCGKAFPVKKALKNHMKIHLTEAEKPHVCHVCGNRFTRKGFLINHLTTHSSFRGFACEVCSAQVKTRDTLLQHRKKVHRLFTPIPDSCILHPEGVVDQGPVKITQAKGGRGGGVAKKQQQQILIQQQPQQLRATLTVPETLHIKEEVLPMLGEELELA